jgi:adenosine deaminase
MYGARIDSVEARRDTVLGCGTSQPQAGCAVQVRWLYQVSRGNPPQQVFAQILLGFLMAQSDPGVVGLNLVQPEDGATSMRDYSLQMRMIQFLRRVYPQVKVTLHAGELAPGLVPDEGLRFHIREAVMVAGARRIGHGVDVLHEDGARELMEEMARRDVMVEIALNSNDLILGIRGPAHPLHAYMAAGVPVALATDDEGVSRSEMTLEYLRTRVQFGKPIGSFQALQHRAVDLYIHKEIAAAVLEEALDRLDRDPEPAARGAIASRVKARCADAAAKITRETIQMHGAIGFTDEFDAGLYLKRALTLAAWLGSATAHRRRYARLNAS